MRRITFTLMKVNVVNKGFWYWFSLGVSLFVKGLNSLVKLGLAVAVVAWGIVFVLAPFALIKLIVGVL